MNSASQQTETVAKGATPHQADGLMATLAQRVAARRVLAIDAFRGLTILVMIFVNTLAGVRGMPAWLDHESAGVDGMTFPDVVFPAFLFIVGMSIPFALGQRIAAGDGWWPLQRHILARAAGLLVLGVFMVNAEEGYNEQAMHMSIYLWCLLFYACAILVWNVYRMRSKVLATSLRLCGVAGLALLASLFRGGPHGELHLAPQWWGILGLIGWAYLYACVFYQLTRGRLAPLLAVLACCVGYWCAAHQGWLWAGQMDNAAHSSIALSGVVCAMIFFGADDKRLRRRYIEAAALVLALALTAWLLRPWFHISKIEATPSWCLYSAAICVTLFGALYSLIDLQRVQAWIGFFRPAASNPLLTYIIPYIVYALMQYLHLSLPALLEQGLPGAIWSAAYAIGVMAVVMVLNRLHIRLRL